MRTIRAISLHQWFASAMALAIKKIETRSWPTAFRGPLAIHAAKRPWRGIVDPDYPMPPCIWDEFKERDPEFKKRGPLAFPYGAIVCVVNMIDCNPTEEIARGFKTAEDALEEMCGNYDPGRYGWITDGLIKLTNPIPERGRQGFWNWQPPADFELAYEDAIPVGKWVRF